MVTMSLSCDLKDLIMTSSDELIQGFKPINQFNENENEGRFAGQLSSEYSLWQSARPHVGSLRENLIRQFLEFQEQEDFVPRILELGCGDGELTKLILDNLGNHQGKLVAVDNEPLMIQKIRQRFNSFIDNAVLSVIEEDILTYLKQCDSEQFDFIISGFTLHNMISSYRFNVLQEVYRVLRPGGRLLDADKIAQIGEEHFQAREWQIHKFIEVLAPAQRNDLLEKIILHYMADEEPNRIRYEDKAIEELEAIGFQDVRLFDRQYMDAIIVALK